MNKNAANLLEDMGLGYLIGPLAKKGCDSIGSLAGVTPEIVSEDLRPMDVDRLTGVVEDAQNMARLESELTKCKLDRYFEALYRSGIRSLAAFAVCDVESLFKHEGFEDVDEEEEESFQSLREQARISAGYHPLDEITALTSPGQSVTLSIPPGIAVPEEVRALDDYLRVGKEMRIQGSRCADVVNEIERILGGQDILGASSNTYYALWAPSFSGKTQLAFALRAWRPLYFAFDQRRDDDNTQRIYQCFSPLNTALADFAKLDRKRFDGSTLEGVARSVLEDNHSDRPFLVLGLLRALILDGMGFPDPGNEGWMAYYLRSRDFAVEPISISGFNKDTALRGLLSQYVFFVDEFAAAKKTSITSAFVRSLAQCVGIRFVCAGTNTRISDHVGSQRNAISRVSENRLWCVVLPRMPPVVRDSRNTSDILQALKLSGCSDELFQYLKQQVRISRGGISNAVVNAADVVLRNACNNEEILWQVISFVKDRIIERNSGMTNFFGNKALMSLCLDNFYDSKVPRAPQPEADDSSDPFIEKHYYQLRIPDDCVSDQFIPLYIHWLPNSLSCGANTGSQGRWVPQCCFRHEEEILQIACFLVPMCQVFGQEALEVPIRTVIEALPKIEARSYAPAHQANSHSARLDGLAVENMAHCVLIDSSHRGQDPHPFRGIGLLSFLERVVANFEVSGALSLKSLEPLFKFPAALQELTELTKGLSVPFLNAAGLEWSRELRQLPDCCNGVMNFGNYRRHPNDAEINGSFELINPSDWYHSAIVHCKHWRVPVDASKYTSFLEKGLIVVQELEGAARPTLLHLSIVEQLADLRGDTGFQNTAQQNNWSAYAIRKKRGVDDGWIPVVEELAPRSASDQRPAVVGIVIVTD